MKEDLLLHRQYVTLVSIGEKSMNPALHRRVRVSTYWASSRIAFLDGIESYEDSYALTQEFREWITGVGEDSEFMQESVLKFPEECNDIHLENKKGTDEFIEI